jgi:hypothetical protein
VALTATVTPVPVLTYEVQLPSGTSVLGAAAVNFGSVQVGSNASVTFLAVNQTAAALTVDAISVAAGDFALVGPSPSGTVLGPQASASYSIEFKPTAAGTRTAVLSIGSQQFTLTGTGAALTYEVQLPSGTSPLGAAAVNFGSVQLGSNATVTFLAVNQTTAALTVDAISVAAGDFALVGPSPSGTVLGPQASASYSIEFKPTAAGTRTAVLSIGSQQFTLTGTGAAPPFSLYQVSGNAGLPVGAQFSFPTAYPNVPDAVTFLLTNTTSQTQTLTLLSMSGAGFTLAGAAAPMILKAGGSAQFTITFQGTATGTYTGSLSATGISVALTATVVPAPVLTYEVQLPSGTSVLGAAAVNFGSVQVGSNASVTFLAVNQTTAALTVDAISVASGDFALVGLSPSGTVLSPQASASYSIEFKPTAASTRTSVLSIGSQQFTLTGIGVPPPFSLYQGPGNLPVGAQLTFGTAYPNVPDAVTFLLTNTTSQTQTLTVLSVSGAGFTLTGAAAPMTVKAGVGVPFTITFQGAAAGSYSGSLNATGISVSLTANVTPVLTYEVQLPSGPGMLGTAAVNFGNVQLGSNATVNFLAVNQTAAALTVDPISVAAGDFALVGTSPSGTVLGPQASAGFSIVFSPTAAGTRTAALSIGSQQFTLTGTGVPPPFSLYQGPGNLPVGAQLTFGTAYPNVPDAVTFLLTNTTSQTQTLTVLSVSGAGFTLTGAAAPMTVKAGVGVPFTITFQGAAAGSYSGSLNATGISVSLTANVTPVLTYEVQLPSGAGVLGTAAVNFGNVQVGSNATVNFLAVNQTTAALTVDAISVAAGDFALVGTSPSGTMLGPQGSAGFSIVFSPTAAGARTAVLSIGSQQFTLTGAGVSPPFSLDQVSGNTELPVGAQFSFPTAYPNLPDSVTFLLTNTTSQTQTLAVLSVSGGGFSPPNAAAPMTVKAGASVQFTVTFQGATVGSYPGSLSATGISVALTANVMPILTYEVQLPSGTSALGGAPVSFGSVQVGSNATVNFFAVNQTPVTLTVDPISVAAGDFALVGPPPSGTVPAGQSAGFSIVFSPTAAGTRTALLSIGNWQFTLTGTGVSPPLPTPTLSVTLGEAQSAQQGSIAVSFAAPAETGGSGTVTMLFQAQAAGETDPGIAFAAGGQTEQFTFNKGDTAASFGGAAGAAFQTGTTTGTLMLAAEIGNSVSQQNVVIAPAVVVATATGVWQTSGVTVDVTGFDNTRTAGKLSFTFYDSAGNTILPGAIVYDSTAAFSSYFAGSGDGGQFALSAYFPVNGDPSKVSGFTMQLVNSAGTATTARVSF